MLSTWFGEPTAKLHLEEEGPGIDWLTPIGPLNSTLATAITKAESDKTETFSFNIGTTF